MTRARMILVLLVIIVVAGIVAVVTLVPRGGPGGPGRAGAPGAGGPVTPFIPEDPALIDANNRGVGLMGQFKYDQALAIFTELAAKHPGWLDVQVNRAIAMLNRQQDGDELAAMALLGDVLAAEPGHLRAHYTTAVLKYYRGAIEEALSHFRRVAEADPGDAYANYFVGACLSQTGRAAEARPWVEKARQIDPYFKSAYNLLAQIRRQTADPAGAAELMEAFQRLEGNPRAHAFRTVYTLMGPKAEALAIDLTRPAPPVSPFPTGDPFAAARPMLVGAERYAWNIARSDRPASITACDLNGDGNLDIFIADALRHDDNVANAVIMSNGDGTFALETGHALATVSAVNAPLWGDVDNDGLTDVYFCRRGPNQLWRQTAPNEWEDVTVSARAAGPTGDTVDGAMFDADHDGDLDILCISADGPNELLNNNLDGTFRPIAQERGIAGDGRVRGSRQALIADLDRDGDADIMVINDSPPHEVYINDRGWDYRPGEGFDDLLAADIRAAAAADIDSDGLVELLTMDGDGRVTSWRPGALGLSSGWVALPVRTDVEAGTPARRQLAIADVNGDGELDVLASRGASWHVASYQVEAGFSRSFIPADNARLRGWAAVNLQCGRGPYIVGWSEDAAPVIWSPGPGRFGFVHAALSGMEEKGGTMRSNASGIGARVQARIDSMWTTVDTYRASSGPGQSLQPIALGMAGHPAIDFIRVDWPDGVFQSELHGVVYFNRDKTERVRDFSPGRCERIEEIQRLTSSCPVLFAWDGRKFEFVSDFLGVGGLGYMVAPGEYAPPRPWENLLLPDGLLRPRNGRFALKVGEPMQEAAYIDAVRLVQYDLPPGWSMTLDERMGILGPEPTGEPRFYRHSMIPARAVNDRGEEVTMRVINRDHDAAPPGELDRRFIGRLAREHVLTITFDEAIEAHPGAGAMLIADGWIEYPYSQTMFAAWQAGAAYEAPTIEAKGADGEWRIVLEQFGYPAGMPREMSVPLDNLPAGTRELRIRSNQEIYWDRLMIAWAEDCPEARRVELPLVRAELRSVGFARHTVRGQAVPHYDYDDRAPFWDTRTQAGLYTAFGPVEDLVAVGDDALAVIGPGEEIHLEFAARAEGASDAPPAGWMRRFVFETEGWCKDMDLYTKDGATVGPLPQRRSDSPQRESLHAKYNTRLVAGE